jgi:hypothetical protein
LALAILAVAVAACYLAIVVPLLDLYRQDQAMLEDRRLLAPRLRAVVEELPGLRRRLAELPAAGTDRGMTLEGTSDALASANLQSRVEQLSVANGVAIGSTEALTAEDRGPYRRIGLRLAVSGTYEAIVKLLGGIETAKPPLVPGNLQLHGPFRAAGAVANPRLEARFEVYGLRNNDTSPVPTK